jgi:ethanolamine utilization protein EutQ
VTRRFHTADDVLRRAATGATEYVIAPGDRLTPAARDAAGERGLRIVEQAPPGPSSQRAVPAGTARGHRVPLVHAPGASTCALDPFPVDIGRPEMDVRLRDVVTSADGMPMAAGVMSLRAGSFPWTLDYDEIEYVLEGELHITRGNTLVVGRPGDVIAVPKGSSITFGTPSWARFLYVTYPADWAG